MRKSLLSLALGSLLVAPAATAQDPYQQPDNTWISLSGTVESVAADAFMLDYGEGIVAVEMDDWDADADAYKVVAGDKVTVTGIIDDDLFETTSIEAGSVYVEGLNSYFYASAADEEDTFITTVPVITARTILQGTISDIDDDEFTLDTGTRSVTVEVDDMSYNPLDDDGFQKLNVGDRVSVSGEMEEDFFGDREFEAESVVTLNRKS